MYLSRRSLVVPAAELSSPSRHTYHAGILWPHHSCLLMHQSLMFSSPPTDRGLFRGLVMLFCRHNQCKAVGSSSMRLPACKGVW